MAVDTTQEMHTIVARAAEQLAQLSAKEADLTSQLQEAQSALSTLLDAKEQVTRELAEKRETLATLEQEHTQAIQLAKLFQGSIREQAQVQQVATLKKQVEQARKEVGQIEKQLSSEKEVKREQALRERIATLQADLTALRDAIGQTSGAHTQAHNELGSLKLQAILEQVAACNGQVDASQEMLLSAQVERQEILAQGIDALKNHPEQLAQLKEALPVPEDGVYQVVNAARLYFDVLAGVLVALPGNPTSQLPTLPDSPEWANKAHAMLQQLPELERLRIRSGGSWSNNEFGESLAATKSKELAMFLVDYGTYLKEQQTQEYQPDGQ